MRARDVMTRNLTTVAPDTPVVEAARILLAGRISAVPVVGADGRMVGIVSEADLMRRAEIGSAKARSWWLAALADNEELAGEYIRSHARAVRDVMTADVVSVAEDATLGHIAALLDKRGVKRVPVVRDGVPVGIVSRANLLQALVAASPKSAGAAPSVGDDDLRRAVLEALRSHAWADSWSKNAIVEGGTVHLWGSARSDKERDACRVAVEGVPGVKAVENHIVVQPGYAYGY